MAVTSARFSNNWRGIITILLFFLLPFYWAGAQNVTTGKGQLVDSKLDWKGIEIDNELITLSYELPYNGVVELRLFDKKGVKIWQHYFINEFGENKIVMKRARFRAGETYLCVLNYKTDEVKKELEIPQPGLNIHKMP